MMLHTESDTSGSARHLNLLNNSTALVSAVLLQPGLSGALMKAAPEKRGEAERHTCGAAEPHKNDKDQECRGVRKLIQIEPKAPFDWSSKQLDHNTHDPKSSKSIESGSSGICLLLISVRFCGRISYLWRLAAPQGAAGSERYPSSGQVTVGKSSQRCCGNGARLRRSVVQTPDHKHISGNPHRGAEMRYTLL